MLFIKIWLPKAISNGAFEVRYMYVSVESWYLNYFSSSMQRRLSQKTNHHGICYHRMVCILGDWIHRFFIWSRFSRIPMATVCGCSRTGFRPFITTDQLNAYIFRLFSRCWVNVPVTFSTIIGLIITPSWNLRALSIGWQGGSRCWLSLKVRPTDCRFVIAKESLKSPPHL